MVLPFLNTTMTATKVRDARPDGCTVDGGDRDRHDRIRDRLALHRSRCV